MSSKNNINTDRYKIKGRGRQGDEVVNDEHTRLRNRLRRRRGLTAKRLLARKINLRRAQQAESRSVTPQA